ncbi:MAG: type II toxin-antitoxin system VapC family toxin [Chloroflexi bacterium]|nr:type II toxin-antitoxin system VapC family toxin [Chloroflexota bacterium]
MIILDTNVVSELLRPVPTPRVAGWYAQQAAPEAFISAVTEAELRYGVEIMPTGRRRTDLATTIEGLLERDFAGRILSFDSSAAKAYATIAAERRSAGRPIEPADAQIAAIARSLGASIATRDARGFEETGVDLINPWTD